MQTKIAVALTVFSGHDPKVLIGNGNETSLLPQSFKLMPMLKESTNHVGTLTIYNYLSGKYAKNFFGATTETRNQITTLFDYSVTNLMKYLHLPLGDCLKNKLSELNKCFLKNTFFVEDQITAADVSMAIIIEELLSRNIIDNCIMENDYYCVKRWFETVTAQDLYKKYLCTLKGASSLNPIEEEEAEAPKKKDPLDFLPPTTLSLDEWKRIYSNNKTQLYQIAMPWFWKNYDSEGWSLYKIKYDKLEDECKVSFLTCNMLSGFLQRFPPDFRKYSFGVTHVLGSGGNFDIMGVWLVRGNDLPTQIKEHPSYEYHTFTKLDHNIAEHKKLVEDYWCSDSIIEGISIESSTVWK